MVSLKQLYSIAILTAPLLAFAPQLPDTLAPPITLSFGNGPAARQSSAQPESPEDKAIKQRLSEPLTYSAGPGPAVTVLEEVFARLNIKAHLPAASEFKRLNPKATFFRLPADGTPLEAQLKNALRPFAFRPIVYDGAVWVIPDTRALTKRKQIATARYINVDNEYMQALAEQLQQPISTHAEHVPLNVWLQTIIKQTGIAIKIDRRSLEDMGLTIDLPIWADFDELACGTVLESVLKEADLVLRPRSGFLQITTVETAEDPTNAMVRVYWLDGTGFEDNPAGLDELIATVIAPDTWEWVGGPSTIAPMRERNAVAGTSRGAIVVSTTFQVHQQIDGLLDALRAGTVDPTTRYR